MYYVYIIYSKKLKKFYIGRTSDLKKRLGEHNSGKVPFTSRGKSWVLVHYQAFIEKQDSVDEEAFLKTGQGRKRRKFLLKAFLKKNAL